MKLESIEKLRKSADEIAERAVPCGEPPDYSDVRWYIGKLADAIQAEVDERCMELPLDADGEPVRVGDELMLDDARFPVYAIVDGRYITDVNGITHDATLLRHCHAPTVEELLEEYGDACERHGMAKVDRAMYASRIREAVGGQ